VKIILKGTLKDEHEVVRWIRMAWYNYCW